MVSRRYSVSGTFFRHQSRGIVLEVETFTDLFEPTLLNATSGQASVFGMYDDGLVDKKVYEYTVVAGGLTKR